MALQFSNTVRDAENNAIETAIGNSAVLKLYDLTAGAPANCAAEITATIVSTVSLPSDWMEASSGGVKTKSGTWQDASADNNGTLDFFRLFASDGTTCHAQGTVTATGNGGDMTVDNTSVTAGQQITITAFTLTQGNS